MINKIIYSLVFVCFLWGCQSEGEGHEVISEADQKTEAATTPIQPGNPLKVESYPPSEIDPSLVKMEESGTKWTILPGQRVGEITKTTTFAKLKQVYGGGKLKNEQVKLDGGKVFFTTTFFENEPNEFIVYWNDSITQKDPVMIKITGSGGNWATTNGVRVGASLEYLLAMNGKDFYFLGFDDNAYGGVHNGKVQWNGGKGGNYLGVQLMYDNMANARESFPKFQNLQKFPTNHPDVKSLGLTVKMMSFSFI